MVHLTEKEFVDLVKPTWRDLARGFVQEDKTKPFSWFKAYRQLEEDCDKALADLDKAVFENKDLTVELAETKRLVEDLKRENDLLKTDNERLKNKNKDLEHELIRTYDKLTKVSPSKQQLAETLETAVRFANQALKHENQAD